MTEILQQTFVLARGEVDILLPSPQIGGDIVACRIEPGEFVTVYALVSCNEILILPTFETGGHPITMISAVDLNGLPLKLRASPGSRPKLRVSGPERCLMRR